ncbi:MAG: VWA domain-containing protein [Alphaproteobacteria bacterium]|nr:VWA domain-containing protein [Alphaproteobacteria bacterium]
MLKKLFHNERGSVMPMVGVALFSLLGAVGAAVDMGRVQIVQSRMQNALDSAGLAAASVVNTSDINSETNKYFYANFPSGYMGTQVKHLTVSANPYNTILALHVDGLVDLTFMKLFGLSSAYVAADSQITRANKGMELVLVMDNTGSMAQSAGGSVTKLQAAKSAGTTLLDALYGGGTTAENLWVGMVPFSQAVNIGTSNSSWLSTNSFNWGTTSWYGCVDAREASGLDVTDDPPSVAKFPQYYWPCDTNNKWYGTNTNRDNCSTSGTIKYKSGLNTTSLGPNKYCAQPITPMTASKSTVINNINSMQAVGNTHIVTGMSWAWRMLSPRWRGVWTGEMATNDLPQDYNTPLMTKVVVLMTDGDNTIDNGSRGAYWYLSNGKLGTTNSSAAVTQLNTRTTNVCTSMKAQGVVIYTIALGTQINNTSQTMLRNCASKPEFYFLSPTTSTLNTIFKQIGDSLANLRISQ